MVVDPIEDLDEADYTAVPEPGSLPSPVVEEPLPPPPEVERPPPPDPDRLACLAAAEAPEPGERVPGPWDSSPLLVGCMALHHPDPRTVAVVCADDMVRERLRRDLELLGCRVLAADSGPALLPLLVDACPAVLLMDHQVVDPDPYEICGAIRGRDELADVAIVMVTRRLDLGTRRVLFHAGADDYLAVPYLQAELLARVGLRLERLRLAQSGVASGAGAEVAAG